MTKGEDILAKAMASNPEDVELRLHKSRFLLSKGTKPAMKEAATILKKITEDQPDLSDAWVLLAQTAISQGQTANALDIALQGLIYRPDDKSLLLQKARSEALRLPVLAIPTLIQLRQRYPNDTDVVMFLAQTYITANQPKKAVELLNSQLLSSNGTADERNMHLILASALYKSGDKAQAQEKFHTLQKAAPDDPGPLFAQVALLKDAMLWAQLSQLVSDWCQDHPDDADAPLRIASELATGEHGQAKKIAEELLRTMLDHDPDSLPAMNTLAMLLLVDGRPIEAAEVYQRILTLQPDNVIVINNLAWILCAEQNEYQQALKLVQHGLQLAPDYVDLIDTRGVLYDKLGQYEKAVQDFTRCLELYPDRSPVRAATHLHLGKALSKCGQKSQAVESLEKALQVNTEFGGLSAQDRVEAQSLVDQLEISN